MLRYPLRFFAVVALVTLLFGAESARAALPTVRRLLAEGKIMLPHDLKRGMLGVGKSVFAGTKIESFRVEILGVVEKEISGGDMILFRVLDGTVVKRHSSIIGGMSGSPVYVNGKLIGAIAYGWPFAKEPIGGISPIANMIESTERLAPSAATPAPVVKTVKLKQQLQLAGRSISSVRIDASRKSQLQPEARNEMVLRPVAMPIMLSGFSPRSLQRLQSLFEEFGFEASLGGGGNSKKYGSPKTEPGAVAALEFARGDLSISGGGTVTFVDGDRVWAFGHPFMEVGATEFPLSSGYVVDFVSSTNRSNKLIGAIQPVGTITADALHAIGGKLGASPAFIPMTVTVRDPASGLVKTLKTEVVNDKQMTARILPSLVADAMESVYGNQPEKTMRVALKVEAEGVSPIERSNVLFSRGPSLNSGLIDLAETVSILQDGDQRAKLKRIEMTTELIQKRQSARIKRMFVDKARVKPGEELEVGVVLEPIKGEGEAWTETFKLAIPQDSPAGVLRVGASNGRNELNLQARLGATVTVPDDLKDLVEFYRALHNNHDLVIKAALPRLGALIDDRRLPMTPAGMLNVMTRARSTTIGTFRDQITLARATEWSITGAMHIISLTVDSKRRPPEGLPGLPPGLNPPSGAPLGGPGGAPGGPPPSFAGDEEGDDLPSPFIKMNVQKKWRELAAWSKQQTNYLNALDLIEMQRGFPRLPPPGLGSGESPPGPGAGGSSGPGFGTPGAGARPGADPMRGTGRPNRSWVTMTDAEFLAGTFTETAITSRGEVVLAPKPQVLFTCDQPMILSLAVDARGTVYAGTGNDGKVWAITSTGKRCVLDTKDVTVTALVADASGNVYAGSAPGGRIFKVTPEGKSSVLHATGSSYVWSLLVEKSGALLAATGNPARVLRIDGEGKATTIATLTQEHARSLAQDAAGNLFIGAGEEGVLYKLVAGGAPRAIYQAAEGEITALAANGKGAIYFGCSTNGAIWRYRESSGEVEAVYRSPQQGVYALAAAADGSVFAGTGDRGIVYRIFPDNHVARALEPVQGQATSLALDRSGRLLVGTANGATVYTLGLPNSDRGVFESPVHDATVAASWLFLRWNAAESHGGYVTLQTRSGNTREPDDTWSAWSSGYADADGSAVSSPPARFIQYRAELASGAAGASPALSRVELVYRTRNQPPAFTLQQGPRGGEDWSGGKLIVFQGRDPDTDVLTYRVYVQAEGAKEWQLAAESRSGSINVDTTKQKDGVYRVRLVVTDEASNPGDALMAEEVTKPLVLDNTPPSIDFAIDRAVVQPDGSLKIEGSASDELSRLVSVDYRIDSGDPVAAVSPKGAFDSATEQFRFTTTVLKGKEFIIEVRVRDSAGNTAIAKQTYTPKGIAPPKADEKKSS